jgi:hypothetical protein
MGNEKATGDKRFNKDVLPESLIFEPWFLPHKATYAIRALLPPEHRFKLRDYFAEWGCLRCETKQGYWSLGLCERCYVMVHNRLRTCLRRRVAATVPNQVGLKHVEDARTARKLLKGFPRKMYIQSRPGKAKYWANNPAQAAFVIINDRTP